MAPLSQIGEPTFARIAATIVRRSPGLGTLSWSNLKSICQRAIGEQCRRLFDSASHEKALFSSGVGTVSLRHDK